MRIRLLTATVAALALAGCGATTASHPKAAEPTTATVTAPSSSIPPGASDAVFDQYAQDNGLTSHGDLAELQQGAHTICDIYGKGGSFVQVVAALTQNGWTGLEAGEMNGAAVAAYCPQYKDKAP